MLRRPPATQAAASSHQPVGPPPFQPKPWLPIGAPERTLRSRTTSKMGTGRASMASSRNTQLGSAAPTSAEASMLMVMASWPRGLLGSNMSQMTRWWPAAEEARRQGGKEAGSILY